MRILLTGATGFVGSAFLQRALARGHSVASLVAPERVAPHVSARQGHHVVLRGTLAAAPWDQIEAFQAQTCLHSAWITTPRVYLESPENERFLQWSQEFVAQFFARGGAHVIGMGTCVEYRLERRRLSETETPAAPTTRYARCKDQLRRSLEEMARGAAGVASWARLFYPYGPREHPDRLCSHLIRKMQRGERASLATPHSVKDYIYIDDVADALITLAEKRAEGIYNIGTGEETSVMRIANVLAGMLSAPLPQTAESADSAPVSDYVVADAKRLKALGWLPRVTLETGLARLCVALDCSPSNHAGATLALSAQ